MIQPITLFSNSTKIFQQNPIKTPLTFKKVNLDNKSDVFQRNLNISFTGAKEDSIRALGNIECPCCGVKMLTDKDFKKIKNGLRQENSAENAIKVLTPYEEYMHETEKECFNVLRAESKKNPDLNFKQILNKNMPKHLEGLKAKENEVLSEIDFIAKDLPAEQKEKVKKATDSTRKMLDSTKDKEVKFKRKTFIRSIEDLESSIEDKKTLKKMKQSAKNMPKSSNDVNAFVVKYAERSHNEIAERLVKLSVGTIEHIHPQSLGGRNKTSNYLLECGECNHNRSSIPLDEWINEEHPEMVDNTKKYIKTVEKLIASGECEDLEGYPEAVSRTLLFESNGLINVEENDKPSDEQASEKQNSNNNKNGFGALTGVVK